METKKPVATIGAGIAGLTAANFLKKDKIPFILFEASDKIAGLAASFKDAEGFSHDFGAHFVTNRLANAIGVGSKCLLVKYYVEAVWLQGKSYNYPFWTYVNSKNVLKLSVVMVSLLTDLWKMLLEGHEKK